MSPNEIQRKHQEEREAVVDEALHVALSHLDSACDRFGIVIQDKTLQIEFERGVKKAKQVLVRLGVGNHASEK